jgi:hypothetical protein
MNSIFLMSDHDSARRNGPLANGLINHGWGHDFRTAKNAQRGQKAAPLI